MRLGIIGLPRSGKTTIFRALAADAAGAQARGRASVGVVKVEDERLEALAGLCKPKKLTAATIEFVDLPAAAEPRRSAEESFAELRQTDALLHVLRAFEDPGVPHPDGAVDPARDYRRMTSEMILADLGVVEKRMEGLQKSSRHAAPGQAQEKRELELLAECREFLERERLLREAEFLKGEEEKLLRGFTFLTRKPEVIAVNLGETQEEPGGFDETRSFFVRGKIECEIAQLAADERGQFIKEMGLPAPAIRRLAKLCYRAAGLRSFFTTVGDELRAWTIRSGGTALEAAGLIHSDMARGFIRAEVVGCGEFLASGGHKGARAAGTLRVEGREYEIRDGDVVNIRFNV